MQQSQSELLSLPITVLKPIWQILTIVAALSRGLSVVGHLNWIDKSGSRSPPDTQ